jgi:hypothetical protein
VATVEFCNHLERIEIDGSSGETLAGFSAEAADYTVRGLYRQPDKLPEDGLEGGRTFMRYDLRVNMPRPSGDQTMGKKATMLLQATGQCRKTSPITVYDCVFGETD